MERAEPSSRAFGLNKLKWLTANELIDLENFCMRHPLGITIVGGLIVSQLLTLYTVPVVYLTFDRLAHRVRGLHIGNRIDEEALAE